MRFPGEVTHMLDRIAEGRTDLVFDYVTDERTATSRTGGASLMQWCAYYGDVSAIRFLLAHGESIQSLGEDLGLNAAAFHGHWRLCQFLLEKGADPNFASPHTGETALHAATSSGRPAQRLVVQVLLQRKADPNLATIAGVDTGAFMRDSRTRAETPLHRAAAFADEETVRLLLDAGAAIDARDMNGDSPLSWGSWHLRSDSLLRKLCYGRFSIDSSRRTMEMALLGTPSS